ncbi:hypothetical protein E2C01_092214 [Portunus trituberculatus]|uniref:Uncharacterized protein n=1 Tax=Portunus trituberculatus TaxID=210409 RepID=A0A5B7JL64_PORTR|nr:hypothetical protein [Portunus trituberculatus]
MAFLGLSAARTHSPPWWVNNTLPQVASALYQLSLRLAQSINGGFDWACVCVAGNSCMCVCVCVCFLFFSFC